MRRLLYVFVPSARPPLVDHREAERELIETGREFLRRDLESARRLMAEAQLRDMGQESDG